MVWYWSSVLLFLCWSHCMMHKNYIWIYSHSYWGSACSYDPLSWRTRTLNPALSITWLLMIWWCKAWHSYPGLFQFPLQWRHHEHNGIPNHWRLDCLLNHLSKRGSKKTPKLCVTGICEGNSPVNGEFPTQRTSNAENVSIWWGHHVSTKRVNIHFCVMSMVTRLLHD